MGEFLKTKERDMIAKYTLITLLLLVSMLLVSCTSQIPVPTNYPYTEQQKMQAAHHWDVLAADVVEQLKQSNKISQSMPLYVVPKFFSPDKENRTVWRANKP